MHRLKNLDAMRGLAALAVIYTHVGQYGLLHDLVPNAAERAILATFTTDYMDLGKVAVTLFFAISGFVIPFSIFRYKQAPLRSFAISRFFRLYPAYWLSIPLGLIFLYYVKDRAITAPLVLANITMLEQFVGQEPILGIYWTLQIELIFYVICAGLFVFRKLDNARAVSAMGLLFLMAALGMSAVRYHLGSKLPVALPLALAVMFWGLSVRYALEEGQSAWKRPLAALTGAIVILIPIVSVLAYNVDMGFKETWYKYTITYYTALGLFYALYRICPITNRIFVYLGTISYSVYLFGFIAQEALLTFFENSLFALSGHGAILLTMAVTVGFSIAVYHLVEAPAVAAGKRVISMINDRRTRPRVDVSAMNPSEPA